MNTQNYRISPYVHEEMPNYHWKLEGPAINPGGKCGWIMPYEMLIPYLSKGEAFEHMYNCQRIYDKIKNTTPIESVFV